MQDEEFNDKDHEQYADEAKARWGDTDPFKQSEERRAKMTNADMDKIKKDADSLMREIALCVNDDPKSEKAQILIARHYRALSNFYDPNLEIYRELAEMYVEDNRFKANYEKYAVGLARFMHDAMVAFVESKA